MRYPGLLSFVIIVVLSHAITELDIKRGHNNKGPITKVRAVFQVEGDMYIQNISICPNIEESFSFVLSLASFLANQAQLYPEKVLSSNTFPNPSQATNPKSHLRLPSVYFGVWCDTLFDLLSSGSLIQFKSEVVFIIPVSKSYVSEIRRNYYFYHQGHLDNRLTVKKFLLSNILHSKWYMTTNNLSKRITIINFSTSALSTDPIKPKYQLNGLMSGIFYRGGDIWTMFKVIAGNIPSVEQLQEQDVVILTGSSLSVLDLNPKVEEFSSNLKKALQINKKIKVLGFCFGHQLISHLYGGILRKKKSVLGEEKIDLISENISKINVLHNFQHHRHLTLFQYHQDCVTEIPSGFIRVGSSQNCQNQILSSKDQRILTFQSHPQYTGPYIRAQQERISKYNHNYPARPDKSYLQTTTESFRKSTLIVRSIIRHFIDGTVGNR